MSDIPSNWEWIHLTSKPSKRYNRKTLSAPGMPSVSSARNKQYHVWQYQTMNMFLSKKGESLNKKHSQSFSLRLAKDNAAGTVLNNSSFNTNIVQDNISGLQEHHGVTDKDIYLQQNSSPKYELPPVLSKRIQVSQAGEKTPVWKECNT